MSILNREGVKVLKSGMRGTRKETGTLILSVNFTLCRREGSRFEHEERS